MNAGPIVERLRGKVVRAGANGFFALDDVSRAVHVQSGCLDVFAVEFGGSGAVGRRHFVARVPAGGMAFGAGRVSGPKRPGNAFGLLAVPGQGTVIVDGCRDGLGGDGLDLESTCWIDDWITMLSRFTVRTRPLPRRTLLLEADPDVPYPAGSALGAHHGDVIWVSADAPMRFTGGDGIVIAPGDPPFPLIEETWTALDRDAQVSGQHTPTLAVTGQLWDGFDRFAIRILDHAVEAEAETVERLDASRTAAHRARVASAGQVVSALADALGSDDAAPAVAEGEPLLRAVGLVAGHCGVSLCGLVRGQDDEGPVETIESLARRSGARTRRITLAPGWWRRGGPSFVGFVPTADGGLRPVAALSTPGGGYRVVDAASGAAVAASRQDVMSVGSQAIMFYPALPDDASGGVLAFSLRGVGKDVRVALGVGALGGFAALLAPVLTGELLANVIPDGETQLWIAALAALLLAAFGGATFEVVRGIATLRIESRIDERLQGAIWSRLLSLPTPFVRSFAAGDLASRANGIGEARRVLTGAAVQAAMGSLFSLFSLALLFWLNWLLAACVLGLLAVLAGAVWVFSVGQVRHYRRIHRLRGELNGFVFQMICGIAKLRLANAESHALARWGERFAEQKAAQLLALRRSAAMHAILGAFTPSALLVVLLLAHRELATGQSAFGLAGFLSFAAAFGQLVAAVAALASAATAVASAVPLIERVRPLLAAEPEAKATGVDLHDIKGDIEFANVTFRYDPDGPAVLDAVSFRIRQGEHVAFVGPSGSGKSTIYRLLLSFERPDSGTVFLDGHDVSGLNPLAMRGRMGVVLQTVDLVAGTVLENISGSVPVHPDRIWAAAKAAAIDEDIEAMPMGMQTMLAEGGEGLSAGQKQRLLIARALVRQPRVLLLDEATSALDNRTQGIVRESLRKTSMTRLVIAHRLSTIRDVDRIYVIESGRIVEAGTHDELVEANGLFAALRNRQLAE